jgi:hypothetical protein
MNFKVWNIIVLTIIVLSVGGVSGFNYFIDPLWMFGHSHEYNDVQAAINERQQKTNHIKYQHFSYDGLLLGSSRTTYINQYEFKNEKVYNYSVSNLSIQEYDSFLQFAVRENGRDFTHVYIGVDFFKTSVKESSKKISILGYVQTVDDPIYRFKKQLSLDLLDYSWDNFKYSIKDSNVYVRNYNRQNVATALKVNEETMKSQTEGKVKKFRKVFYGETYKYNQNYPKVLQNIVNKYPNTKFVVFTTPISEPLFQALVEEGRFPDYEQWIRDLVEVFGGVYNFMTINEVTKQWQGNYFDGHHFYEHVGTLIAHRINRVEDENLPADFGEYVTKENIDAHIQSIQSIMKERKKEK